MSRYSLLHKNTNKKLIIDEEKEIVFSNDVCMNLNYTEFLILQFIVYSYPNKVEPNKIYDFLLQKGNAVSLETISKKIVSLRKSIFKDFGTKGIANTRTRGYFFPTTDWIRNTLIVKNSQNRVNITIDKLFQDLKELIENVVLLTQNTAVIPRYGRFVLNRQGLEHLLIKNIQKVDNLEKGLVNFLKLRAESYYGLRLRYKFAELNTYIGFARNSHTEKQYNRTWKEDFVFEIHEIYNEIVQIKEQILEDRNINF